MNRVPRFDLVLRHLVSGGGPDPDLGASDDPFDDALRSLMHFWASRHEAAAQTAALALSRAGDPDAIALARAVSGLAVAGWPLAGESTDLTVDPSTGADPLDAALADEAPLAADYAAAVRGLLVEAALACARIGLAVDLLKKAPPPAQIFGSDHHPFLTFVRVTAVRVAAFHGEIDRAQGLAAEALSLARTPQEKMFALSCSALVSGNADERSDTRLLIKRVSAAPPPHDALTRGNFVLAAYGAIALGDAALSAKLVLAAGGDAGLSKLRLIDRAIGLEMLVAAAVAAGDLDSAESWLARMAPVATHRIVAPTFHRATSRVLLLAGDVSGASASAQNAIASALADGRSIEVAEGEIVRARALIASDERGSAARDLAVVVSDARARGHLAVHRAAARELRQVGRRLPPVVASGWDGLSAREREVAILVAEGHSNASLATELFVSEHTVRIHVSRVLQAFGVATRSGVAAALAPAIRQGAGRPNTPVSLPSLTARQREVVTLLTEGAANKTIAATLGISAATVEKHVSAILQRWQVNSRAGIVSLAGEMADHESARRGPTLSK